MGSLIFGISGIRKFVKQGFKDRKITIMTFPLTKNVCISISYDGTFVNIYG